MTDPNSVEYRERYYAQQKEKLEAALRLCLAELKLSVSDRPTLREAIKAAEESLGIPRVY